MTRLARAGLMVVVALSVERPALAKHEPPPVVIPTAETEQADQLYRQALKRRNKWLSQFVEAQPVAAE